MPAEVHDNSFPLLHHAIEHTRFTRLHELTTGHPLIQPHLHHSVTTANSAYPDLFADRPSTQSSDLRFLSIPLRSCARKQAGSYRTHKYVVLWKSKMQHKSAFSRVKSLPRSSPPIKKPRPKRQASSVTITPYFQPKMLASSRSTLQPNTGYIQHYQLPKLTAATTPATARFISKSCRIIATHCHFSPQGLREIHRVMVTCFPFLGNADLP